MSELICPHCGASNPLDAIECKKCHRFLFESSSAGAPFSPKEDDWLNSLREDTEPLPESGEENTAASEPPPFTEDVPDWLARIRQRTQEEPGEPVEQPSQQGEEEELPEWLRDVEIPSGKTGQTTSTADEEELPLPDWLSLIDEEKQTEGEALTTTSEPTETGFDRQTGDEELPAWLREIGIPHEETPSQPSAEEEIPAWLVESTTGEGEQPGAPAEPPLSQTEETDWLKSFAAFETQPASEEEESSAAAPEEDWLKTFEAFESQPEPLFSESQPPQPEDESDWLKAFEDFRSETLPEAETEEGPEAVQQPAGEESPPLESLFSEPLEEDWLQSLQSLQEEVSLPESEEESQPISEEAEPLQELPPLTEDIFPVTEGASSAFIFETPAQESVPEEELDVSPFISEELPEWFDEQVFESAEEQPSPAGEAETGLEPAELPGWLEAMRPIEAVAPGRIGSDDDQRIETSGPLSGFQGVLPAEALVTQYSKPAIYSARLQVSEKQRTYANLLETILQQEKQGQTTSAARSAAPQILGRLLVGVAIAVIVLFALFGGIRIAAPPTLFAQENVNFFTQIQSLTSAAGQNTPVLLAVDFEPALAGEISKIASPVIGDLLQAGKPLAVVSSNPTGAALAEDLLLSSAPPEQILNLGYLPGGVTSMAALANQPAVAAPRDRSGAFAWDRSGFQTIQQISDFSAVILLTDNTDTSRLWIEQLSPVLENTPLLIIASSQAAPMIQPYLQSGQAGGMLAGLPGLAAYQQLSGKPDILPAGYLDAFQAGLMLIVVLILVFSLYYLVMQFIRKPETKGK